MRFLLQNLVSISLLVLLRYSFAIFSFIIVCLMVSTSSIPEYLYISFFLSVLIFSCFVVLFLPLLLFSSFLLQSWHIFQIPFLYPGCIFLFFISGSPVLFHFLQTGWYHHHHVVSLAQISLTLYYHLSLSSIASGGSSRLHPVSVQSCCRYVLIDCPTPTHSCEGRPLENVSYEFVRTSRAVSCNLVRMIWMVLEMGGRWPYSCCLMGCCFQVLFNIARSILVQLPSSFFSIRFVRIHVLHPYSSMNTTATWKKCVLSYPYDR